MTRSSAPASNAVESMAKSMPVTTDTGPDSHGHGQVALQRQRH